ncbi:BNR repeat-containing protein [Methylopila sp. M107]|uniref:BNR repeat-containing protein n=1 Tax=Methylopila sp. M107 TaxID=1101190 RepID=UPI00037B0CB1|nr:BNR repeat-containing protein [Methylopila sp. M107]
MTQGTRLRFLIVGGAALAALSLSTPSRSLDQTNSGAASSAEASCKREAPTEANGKNVYDLDQTWSGVRTSIGSTVRANGAILLAYYDADRWVTVAEFDPKTGSFCRKRLDSRFSGWDSHNFLSVSESPDGIIHVSGNVHAKPLFYARSTDSTLASVKSADMIGSEEKRVTYPKFISSPDGRYFFMYRDGGSGNGAWLVNEWKNGGWARIGPIFSKLDGKEKTSAYPSAFVVGPDGAFHVAVVWRKTPDVGSNYALTYASTKDFINWSVNGSADVKSPMTRSSMETISDVGENRGLVNGIVLRLGSDGKPIVIYSKYGAEDTNAAFVAERTAQGWSEKEVARSRSRFEVGGGGTMPGLPIISVVDRNDDIVGRVRFKSEKAREFVVGKTPAGDQSPNGGGAPKADAAASDGALSDNDYKIDRKLYEGLDNAQIRTTVVSSKGANNPVTARLMWFAQGANQDRQRECTVAAPRACDPPPSPLMMIVN